MRLRRRAVRGICFSPTQLPPYTCEQLCLGDVDCDAGEYCSPTFPGLGLCRPAPTCGDGELAELGEACDDGNHVSGDGCSADCQKIEYAPICDGAPLLAPNSSVQGNTDVGRDGFRAVGCQAGLARADVYRFVPPGRGRLRLTLDSATFQLLSLRDACADERTELACAPGELVHMVKDDSDEIVVLVSAFILLEEGPYTLDVEWTDEVCGDGVVAGREACDDGNQLSGDGCRADCGEVEYASSTAPRRSTSPREPPSREPSPPARACSPPAATSIRNPAPIACIATGRRAPAGCGSRSRPARSPARSRSRWPAAATDPASSPTWRAGKPASIRSRWSCR
jgi:cysteine-rich repeat protein